MKSFKKIYTVVVLLSLHSMVISLDSVIPPKVKLPLRLVQPRLEPTMSRVGSNFGSTSNAVFSLVDQSFSALNKNNVEEALSFFKAHIDEMKLKIQKHSSGVVDQSLSALNNSKAYLLDKYEDSLKYRQTLYKLSLLSVVSPLIGFALGHKPHFSSADEIRNWNISNPWFCAYNIIKSVIAYHLELYLSSHIDDISASKTEAELIKRLSRAVILSSYAISSYDSGQYYQFIIQLEKERMGITKQKTQWQAFRKTFKEGAAQVAAQVAAEAKL